MVSWIHLSDLQIDQVPSDESIVEIVKMAVACKPDFVVDTGDCVNGEVNDTAEEKERLKGLWARYRKAVRPIRASCPFFHVPGNHDFTSSDPTATTFLRQTGRPGKPAWFATTVKGIHLIGLDVNVRHHAAGFSPDSAQGKWFASHLRRKRQARCTVLAAHFPLFAPPSQVDDPTAAGDHTFHYHEPTAEKGTLLPILERAGVDLYMCGHFHAYERCRYRRLTQVMPSGHGPAINFMRSGASKFRKAVDYSDRRSFNRFTLDGDKLRGEAIAIDGQIIDRWWQKLNH